MTDVRVETAAESDRRRGFTIRTGDTIGEARAVVGRWNRQSVNVDSAFNSRPRPVSSMVASAARITNKTIESRAFRKTHEAWQDDAWAMFDLVGEQRFLSTTLAQRASQARFYIGKLTDKQGEDPDRVDDENIQAYLDAIGDGHLGLGQLVQRMVLNLFITGDGWLVGIPKDKMPIPDATVDPQVDETVATTKVVNRTPANTPQSTNLADQQSALGDDLPSLDDLIWRMLSVSEIQFDNAGLVKLILGPTEGEHLTVRPDDVWLVRVWRPHPRHWWQADSPTRSSLPVLRELVGLTMHISAQVDSRLAGAGMLIVPESASRALKIAMGLPEDDTSDPFTEALMQSMLTPIGDRSNASALVPLVVTVPDDVADKFHHLTFAKPLDIEAKNLRDEAIRRLALGEDAPPELLLGTAGMNYWGAWLVNKDTVAAHIEPPLALIADALTTQYLRPIMLANDVPSDEVDQYVVWYSVDHMTIQADKPGTAQLLWDRGAISDEALREANGFTEEDAPLSSDSTDKAIEIVSKMIEADPGLMLRPGLDIVYAQVLALLQGAPLSAIDGAKKADATKAVAGTNVEDRNVDETNGVEPVSPEAVTPAAAGGLVPPAGTSGGQPVAAAKPNGLSVPTSTPTPTTAKSTLAPPPSLAVTKPKLPAGVQSIKDMKLTGTLSEHMADLEVQFESEQVLDLTHL